MLEYAVAESVAGNVGSGSRTRKRSRRPEIPAFFVPQIVGLSTGIADRIVMPRSQPVFMGILTPGINVSAFGDNRTELRICQDI